MINEGADLFVGYQKPEESAILVYRPVRSQKNLTGSVSALENATRRNENSATPTGVGIGITHLVIKKLFH